MHRIVRSPSRRVLIDHRSSLSIDL